MTVGELLGRISSRELTEWMAFYKLEPWGTKIDLLGHAQTATTIANVNRGKNQKPYKIEDFMPEFESEEQTVDEMKQALKSWKFALGDKE